MALYWWRLPLVVLLLLFIDTVLLFASEDHIWSYYVGLIMEWITMLAVLAVGVITVAIIVRDFKMKCYRRAVTCLLVSILGVVVLFAWLFFYGMAAQSAPTYYAERHPIQFGI